MQRRLLLAAAVLSLWPGVTRAAGFALADPSAPGQGMAGAFAAQGSDPSAIFYNAAGIAFLPGKHLSLGATRFALSTDFTGADPYPGAGRREMLDISVPVPTAFYTQAVGQRVVLGIGLDAPFGLKTEWDDPSFSGRFISRLAELHAISVNPTLAYRVSDRFSVGGGLDVRITSVKLQRDVPLVSPLDGQLLDIASARLESDTAVSYGFNVGVLAKPSAALSVGLAYRHKVTAQLGGRAAFTPRSTGNSILDGAVGTILPAGEVPLRTALAFPAVASFGVGYRADAWIVEADVNWFQWSTFKQIRLAFQGRADLDETIRENYQNSLQYRFGVERTLGPVWAIRAGYYYDASPAPAASVSPILPDPNRHALALGGSWRHGRLSVTAAADYILGEDRSTEGVNRDGFNGTYASTGTVLGLFFGYAF
jgi:long-chain fatty acid transport protein